jgi:hypothetical protein
VDEHDRYEYNEQQLFFHNSINQTLASAVSPFGMEGMAGYFQKRRKRIEQARGWSCQTTIYILHSSCRFYSEWELINK